MLHTMEADKIKTNRFSVYMIKSECVRLEDIIESPEPPLAIEGIGHFVFAESYPHPPDWVKSFFGSSLDEDKRILTSSAKGVLVIPIKKNKVVTYFAVSFGFGRHLLKDGVVEERFGLKTVLNSLDVSSFRSIDKTALGSVPKHSREQMSRDVAAADFGIDIEQDLISSITGKSRDEKFGRIITGKDGLSGSTKVDVTNIVEFLSHCLDRYNSSDYKKDFEWIDQITDIRDKRVEEELNLILIDKLNRLDLTKIWMAVPEVVDWSDVKGFRYFRAKHGQLYDDLDIAECLTEINSPVTIDSLKEPRVFMISASTEDILDNWSMFRCIYAEIELRKEIYILNNGKWYKIAKGFTEQVQKDFDNITKSNIALPDCSVTEEGDYNLSATEILTDACCMDGELVSHGGGHSSVEFCDIYTKDKKILHIKRYGGSNVLSHLFSQGVVSGELFVSDSDFRKKLNIKLPTTHKLVDPNVQPNAREYEVVYGIISDSTNKLDIPFFSKVSLRNARRRLTTYGYQVSIKQIKRVITPIVKITSSKDKEIVSNRI